MTYKTVLIDGLTGDQLDSSKGFHLAGAPPETQRPGIELRAAGRGTITDGGCG